MNTDRTIILTMLANNQINADEAERLLILTETLHRVERTPHPNNSDEPIMSQLVGDFEEPDDEHGGLDFLTDINDLVAFETLVEMEDFFSLPDLPPFPEVIDWDAFQNFPTSSPFDAEEFVQSYRDLHQRLEKMKIHFEDFQGKFTAWKGEIDFDDRL